MSNQCLSPSETERYSRLLNLSNWTVDTQLTLKNASVAVDVRLEQTLRYLAATGVGCLELVGHSVKNAEAEILRLNPEVTVTHSANNADQRAESPTAFIHSIGISPEFTDLYPDIGCRIEVDLDAAVATVSHDKGTRHYELKSSTEMSLNHEVVMCGAAILAVNYLAFGLSEFDTI